MELLSGYRTYFVAVAIGIVAALHQLGYIDDELRNMLLTLLGAGGLAVGRLALANSVAAMKATVQHSAAATKQVVLDSAEPPEVMKKGHR